MGYYVEGNGYNVNSGRGADLPMMTVENQSLAFQAIHKQLLPEHVVRKKARGGSYSGGQKRSWHYSWCDMDYLRNEASTFIDILEHLGFYVQIDDIGNIVGLSYDSKAGQEDLFLDATREYWEPGSMIYWTGEDGSHWRVDLDTGKLMEGRVVYD